MPIREFNPYELRRKSKRKTYFEKEKKAVRYNKELDLIRKEQRGLGCHRLEAPIHSGFNRAFVLRDDISRSPFAEQFSRILKVVNKSIHSRDGKFTYYDYKLKKKVPIELHTMKINEKLFDKFMEEGKLVEADRKFFYRHEKVSNYHNSWSSYTTVEYYFNREWVFSYKTTKHYITEVKIHDELLEAKEHKLRKELWDGNVLGRFLTTYKSYKDWSWDICKTTAIRKAINKQFKEDWGEL